MNGVNDYFEEADQQKCSYLVKSWIILVFLLFDLLLSATTDYDPSRLIGDIQPLVQTGVQLLLLICVSVMFFLMISATYPFRVGLISALGPELRFLQVSLGIYWLVLLAYAGVKVPLVLGDTDEVYKLYDSVPFAIVSVVQKLAALVMYAGAIDALLRLGEPRFYERREWTRNADVKRALARLNEQRAQGIAGPL